MNNFFSIVSLFFISISIYGQEYKEKLSNDVCKCFTENNKKGINTLENCFTQNIGNYRNEFDKLIDKNSSISEYEQGEIIGKKIFFEMQQNLIQKCDAYFLFFENLREQSILAMKKKYSQSKMDSITTLISKNKTTDLIWERANLYFANSELKNAEADYQECLKMDPNHIPSMFFLGWLHERNKNYNKAIELYKIILNATKKQEIVLFIEIATRKSKE
ncbi:tetratricopeptide repeat protein [Aquimarina sp. Aq78]|uniref:tetratricopeptide repeat protein n=1 Tax=Aquimarina sp. Aq78 TaxID=1191889 RepID=UPI000D0E809D|nr:tetratricopeptide repeat protein [Aquimarina sp. Aq78]